MSEISKASVVKDKEEGGFFSRWSRLKTDQVKAEQTAKENIEEPLNQGNRIPDNPTGDKAASIANEDVVAKPETPVLTDSDMPDIETLNSESDYSGFLSPGVSEELRKLALRKLFNTDYFQIRDGLDDYDEEFTHFEKLGDIITADMRFQMEEEAKAKLKQGLADDNQSPSDAEQLAVVDEGDDSDEDIEEEIEDTEIEDEPLVTEQSQDNLLDDRMADKSNESLI